MRGRSRALLAFSLLSACTTSPSSTELTPDLAIRAAEAVCATAARCCVADEVGTVDDADCRIGQRSYFEGYLVPVLIAAVARGGLDVDVDALETCLDDYAERDCGDLSASFRQRTWDFVRGCQGVIEPRRAFGASCRLSAECTTRFCRREGDRLNVEGTCAHPPGRDEACPNGTCDEGLYCEPTLERCIPLLADGAPCVTHRECSTGVCAGRCVGYCTGGGTDDLTEPHMLEELGALMVEAECGPIEECCVADGELAERLDLSGSADESSCRAIMYSEIASHLSSRYEAIKMGRGGVDSERLAACRAWLTDPIDCPTFASSRRRYLTGPCDEWFTGTIDCLTGFDCGVNAFCVPYLAPDGTLHGDCYDTTGFDDIGASCTYDSDCRNGACVGNDASRGAQGVCRAVCGGLE